MCSRDEAICLKQAVLFIATLGSVWAMICETGSAVSYTHLRMLILASAFRQLLADENFVNLLRAENLANMPEKLAERLK